MSDVSAQAFREAAAQLDSITPRAYQDIIALLLAAAEQREQLDLCDLKRQLHYEHNVALEQQIATLTAENARIREDR